MRKVTWRHSRFYESHEAIPRPGSEVERVRSTGMPGAACDICGEALNGWESYHDLRIERDALAARLARVEALCDEARHFMTGPLMGPGPVVPVDDLRAALAPPASDHDHGDHGAPDQE